jgi:hypothetical protein
MKELNMRKILNGSALILVCAAALTGCVAVPYGSPYYSNQPVSTVYYPSAARAPVAQGSAGAAAFDPHEWHNVDDGGQPTYSAEPVYSAAPVYYAAPVYAGPSYYASPWYVDPGVTFGVGVLLGGAFGGHYYHGGYGHYRGGFRHRR